MSNLIRILAAGMTLQLLVACNTLQPARMALPTQLAQGAQVVEIEGVGGGTRGEFTLGQRPGKFFRSSSRLQIFDIYDGRGARLEYEFDGVKATCQARERQLNLSFLNFSPKPMAYACSFSAAGKPVATSLELQENKAGVAGALGQQSRRGQLLFSQSLLQITSVHELQGSPIRLRQPIGYRFELEGKVIGAVEINGGARIIYPHGQPPEVRKSVELASLALGLFWDPGEYDLVE
ncbi:hypothetical protein G8764_12155 [Pseudomaricurvus alcaniphilus]|uniref:hypothetical protein n=1 Tax=Pseudomaricurvus alcaniphilus TaxID=1166482 RepID=UPI00140B8A2A|nr:hypothetical protein [Pseudomaricurvus alcaniphilus]NHN38053.1 hypothetical protein [Pseudomaricurvus alcaniphilus]